MRKKLPVLEMTPLPGFPSLEIFYATIPNPNAIPGPNPGASMNPLLQGTPC
jgi:hypothetical protein